MSTITKEFTKEQLQQIAETDHVQCGDAAAMARQLLASMEQEPVIIVGDDGGDALAYRRLIQSFAPGTKLYAAPQLPQPAAVDNASREDFEGWARDAGFNEDWYFFTNVHPNHYDDDHINDMWAAWSACRAAMLQGADGNSPVIPDCSCHACRPVTFADSRFVVCPVCGNKRCPHANDHRNACTGSNEPGQEGSAYPAAPQQEAKP